ncbi:MAG: hypothetical protein E6H41_06625 [Betaproteobacteria bacterium]|nr:MAG: hypothetical protein E6H41_06625 [Betaproteobacteria bacterium]
MGNSFASVPRKVSGSGIFTDADYGWVTQQVKAIADRHAKGRIVSALEGGYALSALGRSAVQHIRALAGLNA